MNSSDLIRFESWFVRGAPDQCWLWLGRPNHDGYGVFYLKGKYLRSHRVAWTVFVGQVPDGMLVCHSCDVPNCVNPGHLWIGTAADNNRDRAKKGRSHIHSSHKYRKMQRKQARTRRQLSDNDVLAIRASNESDTALSNQYKISRRAIWAIRNRKTYIDVGEIIENEQRTG